MCYDRWSAKTIAYLMNCDLWSVLDEDDEHKRFNVLPGKWIAPQMGVERFRASGNVST
jgi:hypothetical protein